MNLFITVLLVTFTDGTYQAFSSDEVAHTNVGCVEVARSKGMELHEMEDVERVQFNCVLLEDSFDW